MIQDLAEIIFQLKNNTLLEHLHENLELKESWKEDDGKRLSALGNRLNIGMGWMVIGVSDAGAIKNRDETWVRNTEQIISQHLNQRLDPIQALTSLTCRQVDSSWIIVLCLNNPGAVVNWGNTAYKRAGTTIQEMKPEEVLKKSFS